MFSNFCQMRFSENPNFYFFCIDVAQFWTRVLNFWRCCDVTSLENISLHKPKVQEHMVIHLLVALCTYCQNKMKKIIHTHANWMHVAITILQVQQFISTAEELSCMQSDYEKYQPCYIKKSCNFRIFWGFYKSKIKWHDHIKI